MTNLVWDGSAAEIRNLEFEPSPLPAIKYNIERNAIIYLVLNHLIAPLGRDVCCLTAVE